MIISKRLKEEDYPITLNVNGFEETIDNKELKEKIFKLIEEFDLVD